MPAAMSSATWTESSLAVLCFALGLILALFVFALVSSSWLTESATLEDDESTLRIQPVAEVALAPQATTLVKGKRSGKALVLESCQSCHGRSLGDAPRIGDRKAWAPRLEQGLEGLVQAVVVGKCQLQRQGGIEASEMELARAVVYMIWPRMRL